MKYWIDLIKTIWILLNDYHRTDQVFKLYDLTPKVIQRKIINDLKQTKAGRDLLNGSWNTVIDKLNNTKYIDSLQDNTLGKRVAALRMPSLFEYQTSTTNLANAYIVIHDILHVLTKYKTTPHDEACLQAFSFHHLRVPAPLIIAVGYVICNPRSFRDVWSGYKWGKRVPWLLLADMNKYIDMSVDDVRKELRI